MLARYLVRTGIVIAGMACLAPSAMAATSFGVQTATADGQKASGKGSLSVYFTSAKNSSQVMVTIKNGRPGYTEGSFSSAGNRIKVRSNNAALQTWQDVSRSATFGAPTAGPWYAQGKTCVDRYLKVDTCSSWSPSGRA